MKVVLTEAARFDLVEIAAYIGRDNPERAESFADELLTCCQELADIPERFPVAPRYAAQGIRLRAHRDYLIFYRVTGEAVEILHVVHGARDYDRLLFPNR